MTLITKTAITFLLTVVSLFVFNKPPAPSAADLQPRYDTVYEGNATPPNIPATTVTTSVAPAVTLCGQVFSMAKAVGWPIEELTTVVAVSMRESHCNPKAHNTTLNRDKSTDIGAMQINDKTWCLPSKYWPKGYLQAYGLLTNCNDLFDLETNLRAALNIYRYSEGWRAWGK